MSGPYHESPLPPRQWQELKTAPFRTNPERTQEVIYHFRVGRAQTQTPASVTAGQLTEYLV